MDNLFTDFFPFGAQYHHAPTYKLVRKSAIFVKKWYIF